MKQTCFILGVLSGVMLTIYEFGAKMFSVSLCIAMIVFLADTVVRFDRLLGREDEVPPGFYEWLFRRKQRFE